MAGRQAGTAPGLLSPIFESATSSLTPARSQTQLSAIRLGWEFRHLGAGGRARRHLTLRHRAGTDTNPDPLEKSLSASSNGGEEMGALTLGV